MAVEGGRPKLILPGLIPPDPYLETYLVRPGGATVFGLDPDDRMTVIDRDGSQLAEITVFSPDGADDAAAIGARADAPATVVRSAKQDGFLEELHSRGLSPNDAMAVSLFGEWSPPAGSQSFLAERPVTVVVAAPAGRIVDGAPPPSDLLVEVRRTSPRRYGEVELPAPLAEPRLDFRVDKATALSYEVRSGEYIQVIDVEGKQCSD
jgi:glycine cleavage system T protein (aminomethyltransferase)